MWDMGTEDQNTAQSFIKWDTWSPYLEKSSWYNCVVVCPYIIGQFRPDRYRTSIDI